MSVIASAWGAVQLIELIIVLGIFVAAAWLAFHGALWAGIVVAVIGVIAAAVLLV